METMESQWTAKIQRSISGFALQGVKKGHGNYLKGAKIPQYVRDYFLADARGLITDTEDVKHYEKLAKGRLNFTVTESILMPDAHASSYSKQQAKYGKPPRLDWDHADYAGDEQNGVYYGAMKSGRTWWALATVDSDTGGFTETLAAEGGYKTEKAAHIAARDAALDWCHDNDVEVEVAKRRGKRS